MFAVRAVLPRMATVERPDRTPAATPEPKAPPAPSTPAPPQAIEEEPQLDIGGDLYKWSCHQLAAAFPRLDDKGARAPDSMMMTMMIG